MCPAVRLCRVPAHGRSRPMIEPTADPLRRGLRPLEEEQTDAGEGDNPLVEGRQPPRQLSYL